MPEREKTEVVGFFPSLNSKIVGISAIGRFAQDEDQFYLRQVLMNALGSPRAFQVVGRFLARQLTIRYLCKPLSPIVIDSFLVELIHKEEFGFWPHR